MFGWLTCDAVTSSAHSSKCRGFLSMWRRWQLGKQKRGEIDLRTKLYNFVFKRVDCTLVNWHFLVFPPKLIWRTDLRLRGKTGLWRSCLDSLFASITQADWGETYLNTAEKLRLIYLQCLLYHLPNFPVFSAPSSFNLAINRMLILNRTFWSALWNTFHLPGQTRGVRSVTDTQWLKTCQKSNHFHGNMEACSGFWRYPYHWDFKSIAFQEIFSPDNRKELDSSFSRIPKTLWQLNPINITHVTILKSANSAAMQSRHRSGLQVAMSLNHSLIAVSKGTFCKLHQKQRNKSFYSILMMKTAFMFFGRVSDPTLAPSLSGSINLKNDDDGRSRSWKTDPMPEFAELIETLVGFVPAPTLTLESTSKHQLVLSV